MPIYLGYSFANKPIYLPLFTLLFRLCTFVLFRYLKRLKRLYLGFISFVVWCTWLGVFLWNIPTCTCLHMCLPIAWLKSDFSTRQIRFSHYISKQTIMLASDMNHRTIGLNERIRRTMRTNHQIIHVQAIDDIRYETNESTNETNYIIRLFELYPNESDYICIRLFLRITDESLD